MSAAPEHSSAYLWHLLGWSLPVVLGQIAIIFWKLSAPIERLKAVVPPALITALYLSIADHFAIAAGVWSFGEQHILGVHVGAVPLEEILFFFLSSLLVGLGVALLDDIATAQHSAARDR